MLVFDAVFVRSAEDSIAVLEFAMTARFPGDVDSLRELENVVAAKISALKGRLRGQGMTLLAEHESLIRSILDISEKYVKSRKLESESDGAREYAANSWFAWVPYSPSNRARSLANSLQEASISDAYAISGLVDKVKDKTQRLMEIADVHCPRMSKRLMNLPAPSTSTMIRNLSIRRMRL